MRALAVSPTAEMEIGLPGRASRLKSRESPMAAVPRAPTVDVTAGRTDHSNGR